MSNKKTNMTRKELSKVRLPSGCEKYFTKKQYNLLQMYLAGFNMNDMVRYMKSTRESILSELLDIGKRIAIMNISERGFILPTRDATDEDTFSAGWEKCFAKVKEIMFYGW